MKPRCICHAFCSFLKLHKSRYKYKGAFLAPESSYPSIIMDTAFAGIMLISTTNKLSLDSLFSKRVMPERISGIYLYFSFVLAM